MLASRKIKKSVRASECNIESPPRAVSGGELPGAGAGPISGSNFRGGYRLNPLVIPAQAGIQFVTEIVITALDSCLRRNDSSVRIKRNELAVERDKETEWKIDSTSCEFNSVEARRDSVE